MSYGLGNTSVLNASICYPTRSTKYQASEVGLGKSPILDIKFARANWLMQYGQECILPVTILHVMTKSHPVLLVA